ncbi:RHS repeat domain-containing protein [Saccharothrix lopnurensis]|uniref:RHS repeat domain-containing protein n=1 Tax=Saccharothrix lopnurensis TaxID=1670621 RepID=A0ABW1PDT4_9PSEU
MSQLVHGFDAQVRVGVEGDLIRSITLPGHRKTQYEYDQAGRLGIHKDARGGQ